MVTPIDPGHPLDDFRQGLAFQQNGELDAAEQCYRRALARHSHHYPALHLLGVIAAQTGRPELAIELLSRAISINASVPAMHSDLGLVLKELGQYSDAIASFDRAVSLKPDFATAWFNRGIALKASNRLLESIESYDQALRARPDYIDAYINRGNAFMALRRLEEAVQSHDQALAISPDDESVLFSKSFILLVQGRLAEGWSRPFAKKLRPLRPKGSQPLVQWSGSEDIAGKTVFLHWDQGLGDTIQFSRYALLLQARGAKVALSVQDPLGRLFRQWEPNIEIFGGGDQPDTFDFHSSLMNLPWALGTTLDTIPSWKAYLTADPGLREFWRIRLPPDGRRRVGLAWSGNPIHENDHNRTIALAILHSLLSVDVDWVCLQKEVRADEAERLRSIDTMRFFGEALTDFADTAAVIDQLDLVITVDTSVAHLAGALGKPVWVLLPFMPDFRWMLDRDDSPWYPSARLYRQPETGDWASVLKRVRNDLAHLP